MQRLIFFSLLYILFSPLSVAAGDSDAVSWHAGKEVEEISAKMDLLEDPSAVLTLEDVCAFSDSVWSDAAAEGMNFGFIQHPVWFRFSVRNTSDRHVSPLLVFDSATVDEIDIYIIRPDATIQYVATGNARPYAFRPLDHREFLIPIKMGPFEALSVYIRVDEAGSLQLPTSLWDEAEFFQSDQYQTVKYSVYFGILFTLMLYNLFLMASLRSSLHAYYVVYILGMLCIQATQSGFGSQFIWRGQPELASLVVQLAVPTSVAFAGLFGLKALNLSAGQWPARLIYFVIVASLLLLLSIPVTSLAGHLKISVIFGMLGSAAFLITGIACWSTGDLSARLYTVAWFSLLVGAIIFSAAKLGVLPNNVFTVNILLIGSALEGLLLSFSLAARISQLESYNLQMRNQLIEDRLRQLELENKTIEVEAENKAKSDFIATMSHEFRTPINGVIGTTDLMSDTLLNDEQQKYVEAIKQSGEALLYLINDVLDYSKIEVGKMEVAPADCDLHKLLESCFHMFTVQMQEQNIEMQLSISEDMPIRVNTDPTRVKQVLVNFLANAVKFTDQGRIELRAAFLSEQSRLRFEVADTGIGLTPQQQERLFKAFYQADRSTTRKYGGTGLGLAISKKLADLLDGSIGVESEKGVGSTFWFEIPYVKVTQSDAQAAEAASSSTDEFPDLSGQRLMVAEDNNVNRMVMQSYLKRFGCDSYFVTNGKDAYDLFVDKQGDFNLIFMDYEMPEMDGREATQKIRLFEQENGLNHTPIIAFSAHTLPEIITLLKEAGVDEYLAKPVDRKALSELLNRYCLTHITQQYASQKTES